MIKLKNINEELIKKITAFSLVGTLTFSGVPSISQGYQSSSTSVSSNVCYNDKKLGEYTTPNGTYAVTKKSDGTIVIKQKDTKYDYEVIFEDDTLQVNKAATIANKFINMDKVNAIINIWGVTAPVVAEVAEKNNTIFFCR